MCVSYNCCNKEPTHSRTFQELITDSWSCSGERKSTKHFPGTSLFPGLFNRSEVHLPYRFISWCSMPEAALKVTHSRCPHSSGLHYPHIHNQSPAVSEISHNITNIVAPRLLSLKWYCAFVWTSQQVRFGSVRFGLAGFWVSQQARLHQDRQLTSVNALISSSWHPTASSS